MLIVCAQVMQGSHGIQNRLCESTPRQSYISYPTSTIYKKLKNFFLKKVVDTKKERVMNIPISEAANLT